MKNFRTRWIKKELYVALNRAINSKRTDKNYLVHRYVHNNYIEATFNFIPSDDIYYNLSMIKQQIGIIKIEKAFMSCYMTEKHVIERNIKLEIKRPKGAKTYITRNKEESEIILPWNIRYKIIWADIINNIIQIGIDILISEEDDLMSNLSGKTISWGSIETINS